MVVLAKAPSGVPGVGAVLLTDEEYGSIYT